jgi:periplasmic protein TonB
MFDKSLLDSSRPPVLGPMHWLVSVLAGLSAFVVGSLTLPVEATPTGTKILLLRAAVLGATLTFYSLAACYAYSDARRQGLNARAWLLAVVLTNFPGSLVYLVYSAVKTGEWKRATLPMAYTLEVILVGVATVIPLIYTQALPHAFRELVSVPLVPASGQSRVPPQMPAGRTPSAPSILEAPQTIPQIIAESAPAQNAVPDFPTVSGAVPFGIPGDPNGVSGAIFAHNSVPPPPLPVEKPKPIKRVALCSWVVAARAIYAPKPVYPPLAIGARIQGTVKLEAVISRDGTIQELTVLTGHPLLVSAAKDAVAQWRYQPTLLNGEPVEVATEIDVIFTFAN